MKLLVVFVVVTIAQGCPLVYQWPNAIYQWSQPIAPNKVLCPSSSASQVKKSTFTIEPELPNGLVIDFHSGTISGTPCIKMERSPWYKVRYQSSQGNDYCDTTLYIAVEDDIPSAWKGMPPTAAIQQKQKMKIISK